MWKDRSSHDDDDQNLPQFPTQYHNLQEAIENQTLPAVNLDRYFLEVDQQQAQKLRKSGTFRAVEKAMRRETRLEMKRIRRDNLLYTPEGFIKALNEF